jgi:hypothetical protein
MKVIYRKNMFQLISEAVRDARFVGKSIDRIEITEHEFTEMWHLLPEGTPINPPTGYSFVLYGTTVVLV